MESFNDTAALAEKNKALPPEQQYVTLRCAAEYFGQDVGYHKIQRAVKNGLVPHYKLFNNRKLVRISDIQQALEQCIVAGA